MTSPDRESPRAGLSYFPPMECFEQVPPPRRRAAAAPQPACNTVCGGRDAARVTRVGTAAQETANAAMAAFLIHDVFDASSPAHPSVHLENPLTLFSVSGAFHGGVWRAPYKVAGTFPVAAAVRMVVDKAPQIGAGIAAVAALGYGAYSLIA